MGVSTSNWNLQYAEVFSFNKLKKRCPMNSWAVLSLNILGSLFVSMMVMITLSILKVYCLHLHIYILCNLFEVKYSFLLCSSDKYFKMATVSSILGLSNIAKWQPCIELWDCLILQNDHNEVRYLKKKNGHGALHLRTVLNTTGSHASSLLGIIQIEYGYPNCILELC